MRAKKRQAKMPLAKAKIPKYNFTLRDLELYSKCPRLYAFDSQNLPVDKSPSLVALSAQTVIQYLYTKDWSFTQETVTVKKVQELVDLMVYKALPSLQTDEEFKRAFEISSQTLSYVLSWYEQIYVNDKYLFALPNIDLLLDIGGYSIPSSYLLLLARKNSTISSVIFGSEECSVLDLHNDIKIQAQLFTLWRTFRQEVSIEYLQFATRACHRSLYKPREQEEHFRKVELSLMQILNGASHDIFYLSKSEQCLQCKYKEVCSY